MSLPPLNGLLALEAVMRLGSVSRAADELGVTQPAVSQRLRVLEQFFGRRLIERTSTGFRAGSDVEVYAARLRASMEEMRIASAAFQAQSRQAENTLTVAVLATFAQRWLIPRLFDFQQKFPQIDVRLMTTSSPAELARLDADISIRCGDGIWKGHKCEFLVANRIFPVASPRYLVDFPLESPADLHKATLIQVEAAPRAIDWPRWLDAACVAPITPKSWQKYANSTHALEAATAGLGVAMAHSPFVTDSLAAGRLIRPFAAECPDADGDYYLVYSTAKSDTRRVRLFRDWLIAAET